MFSLVLVADTHTDVWLATEEELLPENSCGHWYPRHVALRALNIYKRATSQA
ncbi:MAG: hypothetical protein Q8R39_04670 [bacterium]|nr:hypothetical protein [bacterium]MDZ4285026.1 hypothetical protein [Patescibacteria group bacterium]